MRIGRIHPIAAWLRCDGNLYNQTMNQVLRMRDEDIERGDMHSGLPSGAEEWFLNEQLPQLLKNPSYKHQLEDHIADLKERSERMNEDLKKVVQSDLEAQEKMDDQARVFSEMLKESE